MKVNQDISAKQALQGAIVLGGIFLALKLIKGITSLLSAVPSVTENVEAAEKKQAAEVKTDVETLQKEGIRQTYPNTTYSQFADALDSAMTSGFGTDEKAIYSTFNKLVNDVDYVKLVEAFGYRRMEFSYKYGNLSAWLRADLDQSEIDEINRIMRLRGLTVRI